MVRDKLLRNGLVGGAALAFIFAFAACDEPPPEKGAFEKAGDATGDALSRAGKSADEFVEKAGETVEEVMDKTGDTLEAAGKELEKAGQSLQNEEEEEEE